MITLDDYVRCQGLCRIDLLKVDVEGGERDVFSGAREVLTNLRPMVICEVLDKTTRLWGYPAYEVMERLREFNYDWYDFLSDGTLRIHQMRRDYPEIKNYLAVPTEKLCQLHGFVSSGST